MPDVQLVSIWLIIGMQNTSSTTGERMVGDGDAECQ